MEIDSFHKRLQRLHEFAKVAIESTFRDIRMDLSRFGFTSRVKSLESLTRKIESRKYENLNAQMTDGVGFRIVVVTNEEVSVIRAGLDKKFHSIATQTNDRRNASIGGYRSLHLVLSPKNPAPQDLQLMRFEVQLRSHIMHSWADTAHMLYKAKSSYPDINVSEELELEKLGEQLQECERNLDDIRIRLLTRLIHEIGSGEWASLTLDKADDRWIAQLIESMTLLLDGIVVEKGDRQRTIDIFQSFWNLNITNGAELMKKVLTQEFLKRLRAMHQGSTLALPDLLADAYRQRSGNSPRQPPENL